MSQVDVAEPVAVPETLSNSMIVKDVLRFAFQGYAIWLEAEQFPISNNNNKNNDLDQVIRTASHELNVFPIPVPHLTMLYGISHLSEREVRKRFQDLALQLQEEDSPLLQPDGFLSNTEIDGINGGGMVRYKKIFGLLRLLVLRFAHSCPFTHFFLYIADPI
jgi:hypothetical protein